MFANQDVVFPLRKANFIIIFAFVLSPIVFGQSARRIRSMHEDWKFQKNDIVGAEMQDFDDSNWRKVQIPHDWSVEGPYSKDNAVRLDQFTPYVRWTKDGSAGYLPFGIGWYRKTFTLPASYEGKKIFIEFDGVYRNSDIWINGHHIGNYPSGYLGFICDVTDHVNFDLPNTLAVKVDARLKEGWWYEGCGIYRPVRLVITDKLYIPQWGTHVITPDIAEHVATVNIKTTIKNEIGQESLCVLETMILDMDNQIVGKLESRQSITVDSLYEFDQTVQIEQPTLWSPDNPYLYKAISKIKKDDQVIDEYETIFGIRTVFFDPQEGFFINGRHCKLKGVCNHDDIAGLGVAVPKRIHDANIEFLKDVGGNFLRCAHNPHSPETLDACDRMGVLVWDETRYFGDSEFDLQSLRQMIRRDRNHPSIICWSMGNEESKEATPEGVHILKKMHDVSKLEDPTRPTAIAQSHGWNKLGFSDIVDVMGYNWRNPEISDEDHVLYPKRVKLGSEYGYHGGAWDEYAIRDYFAGASMWTGFTYRGELSWPNVSWPGGLGDLCHFPIEKNYYQAMAQWTRKPVLYIEIQNNGVPGWRGKAGDNVNIEGRTNCDQVLVYIKDKLVKVLYPIGWRQYWNSKGILLVEDVTINELIPYVPGSSLKLIGRIDGTDVCLKEIKETLKPSHIRLIPTAAVIAADGQDVCPIEVGIYDDNGNLIKDADTLVTFDVKGAGQVIGVGNADTDLEKTASEPDKADKRTTFEGKCLVILQSTDTPGDIRVSASSASGLKSEELVIRTSKDANCTYTKYAGHKAPRTAQDSPDEGITVADLELNTSHIRADEYITANTIVKNINNVYPVELILVIDDQVTGSEQFGVPIGDQRRMSLASPKMYKEGAHQINLIVKLNSKEVKTLTSPFTVEHKPAALKITNIKIPSFARGKEEFRIEAIVQNIGSVKTSGISLPLIANGKIVSNQELHLEPGERHKVIFFYTMPENEPLIRIAIGDSTIYEVSLLMPFSAKQGMEVYGNPASVQGKIGKALKFDGKADYLRIPTIDLNNKPFTLAAWVRIDKFSVPNEEAPLFSGGQSEQNKGMHIGIRQARPFMGLYGDDCYGRAELVADKWYHLAYVLEVQYHEAQTGPSSGTEAESLIKAHWTAKQKIYINGQLDISRDCKPYLGTLDFLGTFWGDSKYDGTLDEVRVFDKALDEEQMRQFYEESSAVQVRPALWMSFD